MRRFFSWLPKQIGQRGLLLLLFAGVHIAYGVGLVLGYHPTFTHAIGFTDREFGLIFIVAGLFQGFGALMRWGRLPYSVGVFTTAWWAFILFVFWHGQYGWTASVSWIGVTLVQFMAAIWPEPVHIKPDVPLDIRAEIVTEPIRIRFQNPYDKEAKDDV